jgi:hypothetical protein
VSPRHSVRNVTLLQTVHIGTLCLKVGRSPRTTAIVQAMGQEPRLWQALAEQEQNRADLGGVDLVLEDGTHAIGLRTSVTG